MFLIYTCIYIYIVLKTGRFSGVKVGPARVDKSKTFEPGTMKPLTLRLHVL